MTITCATCQWWTALTNREAFGYAANSLDESANSMSGVGTCRGGPPTVLNLSGQAYASHYGFPNTEYDDYCGIHRLKERVP